MFEIDDNFLQSIGYDVTTLSEAEKSQYKAELTEELQERLNERLGGELEESQVEDLEGIQKSSVRANQWLNEFHEDYSTFDDYKAILSSVGEEEAKVFYASALWMQDAIPGYGLIIREEFEKYQQELVKKREMVNQALGL